MRKTHYVMSAQEETPPIAFSSKPAGQFEKKVRNLFHLLGFQKVEGGPSFKIGGNQIDACGICEDKLIICECTTQKTDFKAKIAHFKGLQGSIKNGISNIPDYRKYATKNGVVFLFVSYYSSSDFNQYSGLCDGTISFWVSNDIKYYEKIAKDVKNRARYDVLADLGCQIKDGEAIKIPAFKVTYNTVDMYSFFIEPNDLIKVSYVARRESGKRNYYQRMLDPRRLINIRKFLNKKNIFPTNIVVGIEGKSEFKKLEVCDKSYADMPKWVEVGFLTLPRSYQGCWIIDGQHRLYSFEPGMKQKLSVLALSNISLNKQAEFFVNINHEAKPIKSSLIWDLRGDLSPDSPEGKISNAVKNLNLLVNGVFKGKISIPSQGTGPISMATFCETLKKVGFGEIELKTGLTKKDHMRNPFYNDDPKKHTSNIVKGIEDFFGGIQIFIGKEYENEYINSFILDNGGVSVFVQLYKIIISIEDRKIDEILCEKYLKPIIEFMNSGGNYGVKDYKKRCSSEAGKTDVLRELLNIVKDNNPRISVFLGESTPLGDLLRHFESGMRNFIVEELGNENFENLKNNLNNELVKKIEQKLKKGSTYSLKEFFNELTLGELKMVIFDCKFLWNRIFKQIFIRSDSENIFSHDIKYANENIFETDFIFTNSVRNRFQHDKYILTKKDENRVREFISTVSSIFEKQ